MKNSVLTALGALAIMAFSSCNNANAPEQTVKDTVSATLEKGYKNGFDVEEVKSVMPFNGNDTSLMFFFSAKALAKRKIYIKPHMNFDKDYQEGVGYNSHMDFNDYETYPIPNAIWQSLDSVNKGDTITLSGMVNMKKHLGGWQINAIKYQKAPNSAK